jgi:hypothetical protein
MSRLSAVLTIVLALFYTRQLAEFLQALPAPVR